MDDWDKISQKKGEPRCNLQLRLSYGKANGVPYFSLFRRSGSGATFNELKEREATAKIMATSAIGLLMQFYTCEDLREFCVITSPRRRHFEGLHLATEVCRILAHTFAIPFYENAIQCINRHRIQPEFHRLYPIPERKVILFDDIITTGSTLKATVESLGDRAVILPIIGIKNR